MDTNLFKDIESEKEVLQAFVIDPELLYQVDVKSTDFTRSDYRIIYEAMLTLYSDGILFDNKSLMDHSPGVELKTIFSIVNSAFTAANINYHAKRIKDATFNRKSREVVQKMGTKIGEDDFIVEAEKSVMELLEHKKDKKAHSTREILSNIRTQIQETVRTKQLGVPTGFDKLDNAIIGLCRKHFIILGGYTSYGKSTLLCQMVVNICKAGHSLVVFSVEDSKEDKLVRIEAVITGRKIRDIVMGHVNDIVMGETEKEIESFDLQVYDDVYTLEEMDLKIRKHKMKNKCDIVAIDFMQNITTKADKIYDRMSEVAIKLQQMAKKHDVCILGLSQVSQDDKGKIALRGAQELASAADIVLWIDRDAQNEARNFDLIVRKNRPFGKTGKVQMTFNDSWTNIYEII
jgi:replicative DNA helicase